MSDDYLDPPPTRVSTFDSQWRLWLSNLHTWVKNAVASEIQAIKAGDSASIDAFARLRVSDPETIFDSKQIHSNQPLFWDESSTGTGSTGTWSQDSASTVLDVDASTAGSTIRQTFRRFNYQPGKSQLILLTGTLKASGTSGSGLTRGFGYGDADNGFFIVDDEGSIVLRKRSSTSGSAVDTDIDQTSWNLDVMDGTGTSAITLDWTKSQIMLIDMEWLGVGRVRIGFVVDGIPYYVHQFVWANSNSGVYMSTPNLPVRYWIDNDGTYASAATLEHICCSVMSEGGEEPTGVTRYASTGTGVVQADTSNTMFALVGIRLKTVAAGGINNLDGAVRLINVAISSDSTNNYEWVLIFNPTIAAGDVWTSETNSILQSAHGDYVSNPSTSTVTGGTYITGGYVKGGKESGSDTFDLDTKQILGASIAGTPDEIWLCVRPSGSTNDFRGAITWNEYS